MGAGVAGPVLARELARKGLHVGLVERAKFPRRKVCGCCLNASALASLATVGLGNLVHELGAVSLDTLRWSHARASADIPLSGGVSVSRELFDAALVREAVAAGVEFADESRAEISSDVVTLISPNSRRTIRPRFVVAANGLLGAASLGLGPKPAIDARSWIGAGAILEHADDYFRPGVIWMASAAVGYVGAVRIEDGRFDVAAAFDPAFVKHAGGIAEAAHQIWRRTHWPRPVFQSAKWRGTPALTRTPATMAGPGWLAVGDATGYVEPFTGEGMAWALGSARLAVPHVFAALDGQPSTWQATHRRVIRPRQRICRAVANGLRSQWLSAAAVRILRRFPALARPMLARLSAPVV